MPDQRLSNIYKMYRAMRPGTQTGINPAEQIAYYDPGLGSGELGGRIRNVLAAAFGTGISENIVDCYEAILQHYEDGDRVFIFGFSRGAYTARCVANVMNLCGIPRQDVGGSSLPAGGVALRKIAEEAVYSVYEHGSGHDRAEYELEREEKAKRFRAKHDSDGTGARGEPQGNVAPTFIGVFDTVAALGTVIVRRILAVLASISVILGVASIWAGWETPWSFLAWMPAGLLVVSFLWAIKRQFKCITDPPQGGRFRWHFAAWNLKNYDRFLDSSVGYARHALSIDENRKRFPRVGWGHSDDTGEQNCGDLAWLKQEWFAGNHSDIGGSYPESESRLSDIALRWMVNELMAIPDPPKIDPGFVRTFPDPLGLQHDEVKASLYSKSASSLKALKRFSQTPARHQRLKRWYTVCHRPNSLGRTRQCAPERASHKTASTNSRLSRPVRPGSVALPGKSGAIRSQTPSLSSSRSIHADLHPASSLNQKNTPLGILNVNGA